MCFFLLCRWNRVADVVPGKSKAQCFQRFKDLRDEYRAVKNDLERHDIIKII